MPYLIDSDWIIDHLNEVTEAVSLLDELSFDGVFMSAITYMEAFQDTLRDTDPAAARDKLSRLTDAVPVLDITRGVAERGARLRESLKTVGRRIESRAYDLLIAATALEHELTLVTRNVRDYVDIPGLSLYRQA